MILSEGLQLLCIRGKKKQPTQLNILILDDIWLLAEATLMVNSVAMVLWMEHTGQELLVQQSFYS